MPKNQNIITKSINFTTAASVGSCIAVGAAVPANMKRYVTFIAISPRAQSNKGRLIYFCSTTASNSATTAANASTTAKWKYVQISASAEKNFHMPSKIDTEKPLFTIAASKFLTIYHSSAAASSAESSIFVQYYEQ